MLFLPADKFFIQGHTNLAIRGPDLAMKKCLITSKGLPFRPPDKSVPARDEIVDRGLRYGPQRSR